MKPTVELAPQERLDDLEWCGRFIVQNTEEFCFSLDAVLLARFARTRLQDNVLDLGCGSGVIPLLLAGSVKHITAIELNPVLADLARRNVALNDLADDITVIEGDYLAIDSLVARASFDFVLVNPPYYPLGRGKISANRHIAMARSELTATLEDTVQAAAYALRFRGTLALVHLPSRLPEIFLAFDRHGLSAKRLRLVSPKKCTAPNIALIEASRSRSAGLEVLPPLTIYDERGQYTEEVLKIYGKRG